MDKTVSSQCSECRETIEIIPRPIDWKGKMPFGICPKCKLLSHHKDISPKGYYDPSKDRVDLIECNKRVVMLEEYTCSFNDAKKFSKVFKSAWDSIPPKATSKIIDHWSNDKYAPYLWILNDRNLWSGRGVAGSEPDGYSIYFVQLLVEHSTESILKTMITHELGHVLCISENVEQHSINDLMLAELTVYKLMDKWGIDQKGFNMWYFDTFLDNPDSNPDLNKIQIRNETITTSEHTEFEKKEADMDKKLIDFQLPKSLEIYT